MQRAFAERYGDLEQWHWWFRGRQRIVSSVLRRELPQNAQLKVASVGCGPAAGLQWLKAFSGSEGRVVGIDAEAMHAAKLRPGFHYVVGSADAIPLQGSTFDVVLAMDVLEHLDRDVDGLREVAMLAKPGGLLLVTVPALPSLWGGQDVVSQHRRRYTKATLLALFAAAGLSRPQVTYFNLFLFPPIAAVRWMRAAAGLRNRARTDFEDSRPNFLNELLARLFAAERHFIHRIPLPIGVSLLATTRARGVGSSPAG
jgi:2-polyprenyl-3-methyl-5-hydroxy-6-metoxy-1,4-benzoquinol methylase